jgi:hypothetical protein
MVNFNDRNFPLLGSKLKGTGRNENRPHKRHVPLLATTSKGRNSKPSERAKCAITDLPNELILHILDYLTSVNLENPPRKSLVSLSRTNWRFHNFVAEELYSSYSSIYCDPYLFLRTVITNSSLAHLTKHADLVYRSSQHREHKRYTPNAQDKKVIKEGLKALGIPDWKRWAADCNDDCILPDTLHAAIFMCTPNMKTIVVHDGQIGECNGPKPLKWITPIKWANSRTPLERMHRFENLQSLKIEACEMTLADLAPIFRNWSLRKVHLKGIFEHLLDGGRVELASRNLIPPRCNNLGELHIEDSPLQNEVLGLLVCSARCLKVFKYTLLTNNSDDEVDALGSTKLIEALSCQKTFLESVCIYIHSDADLSHDSTFDLQAGWRDFPKLKHLSCPLDCITSRCVGPDTILVEKLPSSLVSFHVAIRQCKTRPATEALPTLELMATQCSTYLPLLAHLQIDVEKPVSRLGIDWARFTALISQTAIDLVIENEQESEDEWEEDWIAGTRLVRRVLEDESSSESSGEVSLYSN